MTESLSGTTASSVRWEPERLLAWLREMLAAAQDIDVHIVVEDAADERSSVQITLRDVPGPLAGLQLRQLA